MTYTLIIPIYNEERTLPLLLEKLYKLEDHFEIIIIDDGSNDNTASLLNNCGYIIIKNEKNLGKGASIRKAIKLASNQNVIIMDGDLEVDINDLPPLISFYENNDIETLIGVRKKSNSNFDINSLGNYLINKFFNFIYSSEFEDVLCCVRILNLKLLKSLKLESNKFSIEVETLAKLVLKRTKIKEMPIEYHRRTSEEGKKLKLYDGWSIIWTILKLKYTSRKVS